MKACIGSSHKAGLLHAVMVCVGDDHDTLACGAGQQVADEERHVPQADDSAGERSPLTSLMRLIRSKRKGMGRG